MTATTTDRRITDGWMGTGELLALGERAATGDEAATRDHVLDLAAAWSTGALPIDEVRRQSTPRERRVAVRFCPLSEPRRPALMALLDALIDSDVTDPAGDQYRTKQGVFSLAELRWAGARMDKVGGRLRFLFPVRFPWSVRPERDEKGRLVAEGKRGEPVLAAETHEGRFAQANAVERAPAPERIGRRWRA